MLPLWPRPLPPVVTVRSIGLSLLASALSSPHVPFLNESPSLSLATFLPFPTTPHTLPPPPRSLPWFYVDVTLTPSEDFSGCCSVRAATRSKDPFRFILVRLFHRFPLLLLLVTNLSMFLATRIYMHVHAGRMRNLRNR